MERLGRSNPRVKWLRRAVRERPAGLVVVDGRRIVEDLVRWGVRISELYLAEGTAEEVVTGLPSGAAERILVLADGVLASISPTRHPQGVLAVVREPDRRPWSPGGVLLGLDRVQEPGNVGAVIRSAAALGASAVLLAPGSADPYHPAAVRGSAGAVFRVPVFPAEDLRAAVRRVREAGGGVWAASGGGMDARSWRPRHPLLLLLGSEGVGLSRTLATAADGVVSIPLGRGVESLNVAVAAGLLLWEASRRTEAQGRRMGRGGGMDGLY